MNTIHKLKIDLDQYEPDTLPGLRLIKPDFEDHNKCKPNSSTQRSKKIEIVDENEHSGSATRLLITCIIILVLGLKATQTTLYKTSNEEIVLADTYNQSTEIYLQARVKVNLRSSPSKSSTILGVLKPGESVLFHSHKGIWSQVTRVQNGKKIHGYVHSNFLDPSSGNLSYNK